MSGTSDKITGNIKNTAGKLTGNEKLQAEGKVQEVKGKAEDTLGNLRKK